MIIPFIAQFLHADRAFDRKPVSGRFRMPTVDSERYMGASGVLRQVETVPGSDAFCSGLWILGLRKLE
jgi:hypothetical protein